MSIIKKLVGGLVSVAVIGVACLGFATKGFKEWDKVKEVVDNKGMLINPIEGSGMSLKMLSASAEEGGSVASASTATIEATVTGDGVNFNQGLRWRIAFNDRASEWVTGKNLADYVTLTPATDTMSATVNCLQAFGEPITVTATSIDNPNCSATCQLDYVKKATVSYKNIESEYDGPDGTLDYFYMSADGAGGGSTIIDIIIQYGVGTVSPSADLNSISLSERLAGFPDLNDGYEICREMQDRCQELGFDFGMQGYFEDIPVEVTDKELSDYEEAAGDELLKITTKLDIDSFGLPAEGSSIYANDTYNFFKDCICSYDFYCETKIAFYYGDTCIDTQSVVQVAQVCGEDLPNRTSVTDVALSKNNVVFW